jgi:hypothetical protein
MNEFGLSENDILRIHRFGIIYEPMTFREWLVVSKIWHRIGSDALFGHAMLGIAADNFEYCRERAEILMGLRRENQ